jgi:hypothetical protein
MLHPLKGKNVVLKRGKIKKGNKKLLLEGFKCSRVGGRGVFGQSWGYQIRKIFMSRIFKA